MNTAAIARLLRIGAPGPGQTPITAGSTSTSATAIPAGASKLWLKVITWVAF